MFLFLYYLCSFTPLVDPNSKKICSPVLDTYDILLIFTGILPNTQHPSIIHKSGGKIT